MEIKSSTVHKIELILGEEEFEFNRRGRLRATRLTVAGYDDPYKGIQIYVHKITASPLKKDGTLADLPETRVTFMTINQDELPAMTSRVIETIERIKERIRLDLHRDYVQIKTLNDKLV